MYIKVQRSKLILASCGPICESCENIPKVAHVKV